MLRALARVADVTSRSASRSGTRSGRAPSSRTSRRRRAACASIETLARAGLSVGVNVAPIIPGLNDQDIPKILAAARDAGATSAGCVLLRLPGSVKQVFEERLREALPLIGRSRAAPHPRDARRATLRSALRRARRGEGTTPTAIRRCSTRRRRAWGWRGTGRRRRRRQVRVATCRTMARPPLRSANCAAERRPSALAVQARGRHDGDAPAAEVRAQHAAEVAVAACRRARVAQPVAVGRVRDDEAGGRGRAGVGGVAAGERHVRLDAAPLGVAAGALIGADRDRSR